MSSTSTSAPPSALKSHFDPLDTHPPLPARAVRGKGAQGGAGKNRKGGAAQNNGGTRAPKSVTIKGFGGVGSNNNNNNNNNHSANQNHNNHKTTPNATAVNTANNNNANNVNNVNNGGAANPPPASSAPTSIYAPSAGIFIAPAHALPSMMAGRFAPTGAPFPPPPPNAPNDEGRFFLDCEVRHWVQTSSKERCFGLLKIMEPTKTCTELFFLYPEKKLSISSIIPRIGYDYGEFV